MKKVMNKKAIATRFIIIFLVGIIAAVIVILGVYGTFDAIFGKIGLLPGELEAVAQSCGISASGGLVTSYCNEFKYVTIAGTKQYATCEHLEQYAEFEKLGEECDSTQVETLAKKRCETLKDDKLVNGLPCYIDGKVATPRDEWNVSKSHLG